VKGVLGSTAVLLAVAAQPAAAAFPGTNGPIAMERPGPRGATIALVNADGTNDRGEVIAVGPNDRDPTWSPDGRHLAFTSTRDGNEEIYVWDADTGNQARLTFSPARDHDPTWSPDGMRIAFVSERDGNPEIYSMTSTGGDMVRLTVNTAEERQPAWSSAGTIAFVSDRAGDLDIYVMDAGGGGLMQLTQTPGADVDPSWAPLGNRLAYAHADDAFSYDVRAIDANGQNQQPLAATGASEHFPAWSPDGTRIAYAIGPTAPNSRILVMPAEGPSSASAIVSSGTDPNWGPLPIPVAGPDLGHTVTVTPLDAQVLIAPATTTPPIVLPDVLQAELRTASEVPTGTTVNASLGKVAIEAVTTTPDGPGTVGRAEVRGGIFTIFQIGDREPTLRMRPGIRPCQPARAARVPPEARIRIRARGRFRTVGGYGRGAGRGTEWVMRERCDGTVFRVFEGIVSVHDYTRRRSVDVVAGQCYLAATRKRPDTLRPRAKCPRVRRAR